MKFNFTQGLLHNLIKGALFICVIAIIVQFFPTESNFKYQFEKGKPWSYEFITASFDFPIYKNEKEISSERVELLKNYSPYFQIDTNL